MSKNNSRALIKIEQYSSKDKKFAIGSTVRSYSCGFDNDKPFRYSYIQGVVIAVESWLEKDDYLKVSWIFENYFGEIFKVVLPTTGASVFSISVHSPWLVKVNKSQLSLAI